VAELIGFYRQGLTPLQAGKLIAPYLGLWIKASGTAHQVFDGGADVGIMMYDGGNAVECRFSRRWDEALMRINPGEQISVTGQIGPHQNGAQLYLRGCELDS
jgi:hypothetical protein